jgi:hypothetical protein
MVFIIFSRWWLVSLILFCRRWVLITLLWLSGWLNRIIICILYLVIWMQIPINNRWIIISLIVFLCLKSHCFCLNNCLGHPQMKAILWCLCYHYCCLLRILCILSWWMNHYLICLILIMQLFLWIMCFHVYCRLSLNWRWRLGYGWNRRWAITFLSRTFIWKRI